MEEMKEKEGLSFIEEYELRPSRVKQIFSTKAQ